MAKLKDHVQTVLDESRILVLGTQVLLGFQYRSFFEGRFAGLPDWAKTAKLVALALMLAVFCLIALPASYHRLVARGEDRPEVVRFGTRVLRWALAPFAIAMGLDLAVSSARLLGTWGAVAFGAGLSGLALGAWEGITWAARRRRPEARHEEPKMEPTKLTDKIRHLLTEARMVLPGAQALLGFQLAATLTEPFDALPRELQLLHLGALALIAVAVILLILPAAWHRIVERGEQTEQFHRLGSRLVIAAMVPLALALALDLLVVVEKVSRSRPLAFAASAVVFAVFVLAWFGVPLAIRARRPAPDLRAPRPLPSGARGG